MWWKKDDIEFYKKVIKRYNVENVLELCCGTGRIGLPLIDSNINYSGIDISQNYIDFFNSKLGCNTLSNIQVGNAQNFSLNKKFDLIIIGFNSIAHLLNDEDIMSCFKSVYNHMHKKSIFIIDIFMPTHELTSNLNTQKIDLMDFKDSTKNQILKIYESNQYNHETEVNTVKWEFYNQKKFNLYSYQFDMRMLFPDTLHSLLAESKLLVSDFYGNYDFSNFESESEKQIYICKIKN